MGKRIYNKPELLVVKIQSQSTLLAGSEPTGDPSDEKVGGADTGSCARRASFSTFDGEE